LFNAVLDPVLLQNPGGQISGLNPKFRHRRCFEEDTFLRTAQSIKIFDAFCIKIFDAFSEQIQNRSTGSNVQPQEKRIWNYQSSGEELDNQWIFKLVIVTFRPGTVYDVSDL
jgi:hypothetical protein